MRSLPSSSSAPDPSPGQRPRNDHSTHCREDELPEETHPAQQVLTRVSQVVSGLFHTCALRNSDVLCCGSTSSLSSAPERHPPVHHAEAACIPAVARKIAYRDFINNAVAAAMASGC